MEEQGLTGPEAAKGPAPTLALLNSALADVGFQLDQRRRLPRPRNVGGISVDGFRIASPFIQARRAPLRYTLNL